MTFVGNPYLPEAINRSKNVESDGDEAKKSMAIYNIAEKSPD